MRTNILKIIGLLVLCSFGCISCSKDDGAPDVNSVSQMEKNLVGLWYSESGWSYSDMWLFEDEIVISSYGETGVWDYVADTQTIAINGSYSTLINIHSFAKDRMTCTSPSCTVTIGYRKGTNSEFAEIFNKLAYHYYKLPLKEKFTFDDNFNGISASGKKITIRNPFSLMKSSILYDGKEYKYDLNADINPDPIVPDDQQSYTYGPSNCFNRMVDLESRETYISLNPVYKFEFTLSTKQLKIEMSNLRLPSGGFSGFNLRLPDVPFKLDVNDGFYTASASTILPVGQTTSMLIKDFNFRACPTNSIYFINFTINDRYKVTTYPMLSTYYGSIAATNLTPGASETLYSVPNDKETSYKVLINPEKNTAILAVFGGKYSKNMTRCDFAVRELPVVLTEDGYVISTGNDVKDLYDPRLVESSTAKPIPNCSISNISVNGVLRTGASISFDCNLGDLGKYSVRATLGYIIYDSTTSLNGN